MRMTLFMNTMKRFLYACLITLLFQGCNGISEKIELEVSPREIVVYSEGVRQIQTNVDDATFSSEDDYYASVDNSGLVTGNKVGTTNILVQSAYGSASIPISIMPRYDLYPDLEFYVGKGLYEISNAFGHGYDHSKSSKGEDLYVYRDISSYVDFVGFTLSNNICIGIVVAVPSKNTSLLTKHLIERYAVAGMRNGYYYFTNRNEGVVIGLTVYSVSTIAVVYMEYTKSNSLDSVFIEGFKNPI